MSEYSPIKNEKRSKVSNIIGWLLIIAYIGLMIYTIVWANNSASLIDVTTWGVILVLSIKHVDAWAKKGTHQEVGMVKRGYLDDLEKEFASINERLIKLEKSALKEKEGTNNTNPETPKAPEKEPVHLIAKENGSE